MSVFKEFHIAVTGAAEVGKTNIISRLTGGTFNRKASYKPSSQEEPTKTSIEVVTSAGLLLFHLYDWAWVEKRKEVDLNVFNQRLGAGSDAQLFVYSVASKESRRDFEFFSDWYERAAGFDKPCLVVGNKSDSKKIQVTESEGKALAARGNRRAYVAVSLVDDTGIDELVTSLSRLMTNDLNLTVSTTRLASEESLLWSVQKRESLLNSIHSEAAAINVEKTVRVLCIIPNSSVFVKFEQALEGSVYYAQQLYSADAAEEEILADTLRASVVVDSTVEAAPVAKDLLPVGAVVGPPSMTEGQQATLKALAVKHNIHCVIAAPRTVQQDLKTVQSK